MGWGGGRTYIRQGTFLFSSQNSVSKLWFMLPGNGPLYFLNNPCQQRWQTFPRHSSLSFSIAVNSCSSPLPFLDNLALKQRKAKGKNWWRRLAKAGCQKKGIIQKIMDPQAPMFNYSDHIIPLFLVQLTCSVLQFCTTFSICYCK